MDFWEYNGNIKSQILKQCCRQKDVKVNVEGKYWYLDFESFQETNTGQISL